MTATMQAALTQRARPNPPGPLSASLTFGWRALLKIKHVPQQLFDVTMFPIMFTLLFTFLFGNALAGSTRAYARKSFIRKPGARVSARSGSSADPSECRASSSCRT